MPECETVKIIHEISKVKWSEVRLLNWLFEFRNDATFKSNFSMSCFSKHDLNETDWKLKVIHRKMLKVFESNKKSLRYTNDKEDDVIIIFYNCFDALYKIVYAIKRGLTFCIH